MSYRQFQWARTQYTKAWLQKLKAPATYTRRQHDRGGSNRGIPSMTDVIRKHLDNLESRLERQIWRGQQKVVYHGCRVEAEKAEIQHDIEEMYSRISSRCWDMQSRIDQLENMLEIWEQSRNKNSYHGTAAESPIVSWTNFKRNVMLSGDNDFTAAASSAEEIIVPIYQNDFGLVRRRNLDSSRIRGRRQWKKRGTAACKYCQKILSLGYMKKHLRAHCHIYRRNAMAMKHERSK